MKNFILIIKVVCILINCTVSQVPPSASPNQTTAPLTIPDVMRSAVEQAFLNVNQNM